MTEATLIRKMTELRDDLCVKDGHLNGVRAQGVNRAIFITGGRDGDGTNEINR